MIQIFATNSQDRQSLGQMAINISNILQIEHMDVLIDVTSIESGWHGYCDVDSIDPNRADVFINETLSYDDKVIALAHELIHVCQFANQMSLDEDVAYENESIIAEMAVNLL
tara:strand:+ start:4121 stop:4456 length:336 start_codon:yes stop_codon:yes gene_type:complete